MTESVLMFEDQSKWQNKYFIKIFQMIADVVKTAPNILTVRKLCLFEFRTDEFLSTKTETWNTRNRFCHTIN